MNRRLGGRIRRLEQTATPKTLESLPEDALIDRMVDCLLALPEDVVTQLLAPVHAATEGTGEPRDIWRARAHQDRGRLAADLATAAKRGLWPQITTAARSLWQATDASWASE